MSAGERETIAVNSELYVQASPEARYLYDAHAQGLPMTTVVEEMSALKGRRISPAVAEEAMQRVVGRIAALAARGPKRSRFQLFMLPVVPPRAVNAVATVLCAAYAPLPALLLLAASVSAVALSFGLAHGAGRFGAGDWIAIFALFLATAVAHEFGHASACRRFGLEPRSIGITAYLFMPAFYSDVTATWLLRPAQRLIVDLGGVFFQLIAIGVIACVAIASDSALLRRAELLSLVSIAVNVVPVFRFDGYWALADALAVPDLDRESFRTLCALLTRRPTPYAWPKRAALVAFALFNGAVWCYVAAFSVMTVAFVPGRVFPLLAQLASGHVTPDRLWSAIVAVTFFAFTALGLVRITRVVAAALSAALATWRTTRASTRG
ncbi:MAG TPA: hypothetical protein VGX96_04185 [Candidatus Elarobacter sp.]|jgi:putative peptide zinc metalloprotease protein|nr:hypothetical protein [Candidatus Elarobacter sp.]